VKELENKEITLISLEKAISLIEPYITVFYDMLTKAVPMNFDALEVEKEKVLSDISESDDDSFSSKSADKNEIDSIIEDQLLTNEAKTAYLLNYLHSFININCSNIMDRELIEVIIEIFLDSLIPYLEIVNSWFKNKTFISKFEKEDKEETNITDLPKFLKPFMKEILHIRKSMDVIHKVQNELTIDGDKEMQDEFEQFRTW